MKQEITLEYLKDKTIILGLSSAVDENGNPDLNSHITYNDERVPFDTGTAIMLSAHGRPLPETKSELKVADTFMDDLWEKNKKQNNIVTALYPATNAWKPESHKGTDREWQNALTIIGWEKITKGGAVIKPNILINLSKISPDILGHKNVRRPDGTDYITLVNNFDMGLFDGSLDESGVQILREWEALASHLGVEKIQQKGGGYKFLTKDVRYYPDWQEKERGLPYPSLRFVPNKAMYLVIKWKPEANGGKGNFGRDAVKLFNLDGTPKNKQEKDPVTGLMRTVQRKEPGFSMIGDAKFMPFSWDSKTCRETFTSYYSCIKKWQWRGDDTNL